MQNTVRWLSDRFWCVCHYSWRNNYLEPLVKRKLEDSACTVRVLLFFSMYCQVECHIKMAEEKLSVPKVNNF